MNVHIEEDTPSTVYVNREVVRLLFSYLLRYRRYLFWALLFVSIITATNIAAAAAAEYVELITVRQHLPERFLDRIGVRRDDRQISRVFFLHEVADPCHYRLAHGHCLYREQTIRAGQ